MSKYFKLIVVIILFLTMIGVSFWFYFQSTEYRFRHIITAMKQVQYGDTIDGIGVMSSKTPTTSFNVEIKPNTLTKQQVYELGISLTEVIDDMFNETKRIESANVWHVHISIYPVPNQSGRGIGFDRMTTRVLGDPATRPEYDPNEPTKFFWMFSGDLDDVEKVWYVTPPIETTE